MLFNLISTVEILTDRKFEMIFFHLFSTVFSVGKKTSNFEKYLQESSGGIKVLSFEHLNGKKSL